MIGDLVLALGSATVNRQTLLGHNLAAADDISLRRTPGSAFAVGETVRTDRRELPQPRRSHAVFGAQPRGRWGYVNGVSDHGVVAGALSVRTKTLPADAGSLLGTDLVRLVLERCDRARQGVDLLTELTERYGQRTPRADGDADSAFVIADGREGFVIETYGRHWVCQDVLQTRAVSNLCSIRQDWDRISAGLAADAITRGWWNNDGSKLDFADALALAPTGESSALTRWGRGTMLLEQQSGHIDVPFLRRVLADHYEGTCLEPESPGSTGRARPICPHACARAFSVILQPGIREERLACVWYAVGPPCLGVYLPLFPDAAVPGRAETADAGQFGRRAGDAGFERRLAALQARFDEEAERLAVAAARDRGAAADEWERRAAEFMEQQLRGLDHLLEETADASANSSSEEQCHAESATTGVHR